MRGSITAQQLDPLGGITARVLVVVGVAVGLVVAVGISLTTTAQVGHPVLEAAALLAITASGVYYIRATSPFRVAFSMRSHAIVCLLALAAVLLNALAQWGSNTMVRDDWGPLAMAIVTVTMGSYRPAREIVVCSLVCAAVIAALSFLQADTFRAEVPALVYAILPATPVLASGAAAATFSRSLVGSLLDWRRSAGLGGASALGDADQPDVRRASHLVHLDEQVLPFLRVVAHVGEVSEADGARARLLARELRTLMLIDTERSWLERIVRRVSDPQRVAERMGESERGFLRAVVAHVQRGELFDAETLRLTLREDAGEQTVTAEVECLPGRSPRVHLAPYIAVAHSLFDRVDWQIAGTALTIVVSAGTPARIRGGQQSRRDGVSEGTQ